jgi:hypothetical protein
MEEKRKKFYSRSSGERPGKSLNRLRAIAGGVAGSGWFKASELQNFSLSERLEGPAI